VLPVATALSQQGINQEDIRPTSLVKSEYPQETGINLFKKTRIVSCFGKDETMREIY